MFTSIRQSLLQEALKSPALLSDLAGLENYIAESYDSRSFVELLQNADDASASRFAVQRVGEWLLVANDGREFTQADFESLCRSAASSKDRGVSIGYRGIGFKSVVGLANVIHLFSGELEATFSRELTAHVVPQASRVPLVRIPHPVDPALRNELRSTLAKLFNDGFKTVFVFADLVAISIEAEFAAFDSSSLLFLRNVRQVELKASTEALITVRRETVDERTSLIRLASSEGVTNWTVIHCDRISIAFVQNEAGIMRLDERQAVVHAFLPTLESTGFPFKVNGDISTDPSRTRIILDERTTKGIGLLAKLIVSLVSECLSTTSANEKLLAALVPLSDPRMAAFQRRGFKTELYAAIKCEAGKRFHSLLCRPQWLNASDFCKLAKGAGVAILPRSLESIDSLTTFLKFLGARDATLNDVSCALNKTAPSITGAAEIVTHLANLHATKQIAPSAIDTGWKLWPIGEAPLSLNEAKALSTPLARTFIDLIVEKTGTQSEVPRMLESLADSKTAIVLFPNRQAVSSQGPAERFGKTSQQQFSLKRWRGAEQQVLAILQAWNWKAEDVSRQNVGYDIEGRTPQGEEVFIEVKSIDYPGQAFILTSNEEAVARQKGNAYRLAVVRQTNSHLEVLFIQDPARSLKMTRQCRQWVWECSEYEFSPEKFVLD